MRVLRGRRLALAWTPAALLSLTLCSAAAAAPGELDPTFGPSGNGIDLIDLPNSGVENGRAVAAGPNGQTYVAGDLAIHGVRGIFVARYNANGTLDRSYGQDGIAVHEPVAFDGASYRVTDLAVLADGTALMSSTATLASGSPRMAFARTSPTGFPDQTVGNSGLKLFSVAPGATSMTATGIAQTADGAAAYIVGSQVVSGVEQFALIRVSPTGVLDTTFGVTGFASADFGVGPDVATDVAVLGTAILAGGYAGPAGGSVFAAARWTSAGTLDSGFSDDGLITADFTSAIDERARSIAIFDPNTAVADDERLVMAGSATSNSGGDPAVSQVALSSNNAVTGDTAGGFVRVVSRLDNLTGSPAAEGVAIAVRDTNGATADGWRSLVAARTIPSGQSPVVTTTVLAFTQAGALDPAFSADGREPVTSNGGKADPSAIAVDATGRPLVVGTARPAAPASPALDPGEDYFAARVAADGTLQEALPGGDTGFALGEVGRDVAPDPQGGIVVTGEVTQAGDYRSAVARYTASGTRDATFSGDGVATLDLVPGVERPAALVVAPDRSIYLAIAAGPRLAYTPRVVHLTADGVQDMAFGTAGSYAVPHTGTTTVGSPLIALDRVGDVLVAVANATAAIVQKLDPASGTPYATYGDAGKATLARPAAFSRLNPTSLTARPDGGVVIADWGSAGALADYRVMLHALTDDGQPDTAFDGDGLVMQAPAGTSTNFSGTTGIDPLGRLVVSGSAVSGSTRIITTRYDAATGAPDATYGGGVPVFGPPNVSGLLRAVQPDGKLVGGFQQLTRFTLGGSLDTSFGTDGLAGAPQFLSLWEMAVQADGKSVSTGSDRASTGQVMATYRTLGDVADLSAALTAPAGATAGDTVTFSATVGNAGPQAAEHVVLSHVLAGGATLVAATPSQGACTGTTTIECRLGAIASGGSATVALALSRADAGTLAGEVSVSTPTADPDAGDRQAAAQTLFAAKPVVIVDPVTTATATVTAVPTAGPGPGTPDRIAPVLKLKAARTTFAVLLRKGVALTAGANEPVAGTTILVLKPKRGKAVTIGTVKVAIAKAGIVKVSLKLSAKGKKALRKAGRRAKLSLVFRAADAARNAATRTVAFRAR